MISSATLHNVRSAKIYLFRSYTKMIIHVDVRTPSTEPFLAAPALAPHRMGIKVRACR